MRLLPFFLLTFLLSVSLQASSIFGNKDQQNSSIYLNYIKELLITTQKTRGLTNSYLNGEKGAVVFTFQNRSKMKKVLLKMQHSALTKDPYIKKQTNTIEQELLALNKSVLKMEPKKAFQAYSQEIAKILTLAQTLEKRMSTHLDDFGKKSAYIMVNIILPLTESVGQLRGYGAGIAAKKFVSTQDKKNITVIIHNIEKLKTQLDMQMQKLVAQYQSHFTTPIRHEVSVVDAAIDTYIQQTTTHLLVNPKNVDADQYFQTGTQLIAKILRIYKRCNDAMLDDAQGWF